MAELETKKYSTDDQMPLLSLKADKNQPADQKSQEEQEALWNRSLEFFRDMKASTQRMHG